jgi:dihydropteroate synthase
VNATPLSAHSLRAVRDVLRSHGWEPGLADAAASGMAPAAFHLTGLDATTLEALVRFAGQLGLEVTTGDRWAVLAGSRSRLSAFARPWTVPEPLRDAAVAVGMAMTADPATEWRTARGLLRLDRPVIVGILNSTPDSFSDGGADADVGAAVARAEGLVEAGAEIIDIGGESTRPGRTAVVPAKEELGRVLPVVERLARSHPDLLISIDTTKAEVATAAVEAGCAIVNDVSGLRFDPAMAPAVARLGAGVVVMHSRGEPLELASLTHASYADPVAEVLEELGAAVARATGAGIPADAIAVDPGLGFAKTAAQNILLSDQLSAFLSLGRPLLVGPSRKRFLGAATGRATGDRDTATAAACALAWERGARLFRVHDVAGARDALMLAHALGGSALPS